MARFAPNFLRSVLTVALIAPAFAGAVLSGPARAEPALTILGNPQAKLEIVELVDYQCPYCQIVHKRLMQAVEADNNARIVIKPLPWVSEESGWIASLVVASRAQGKEKDLHNALLNLPSPPSLAQAKEIAAGLGVDLAKAEADMKSEAVKNELIANLHYAREMNMQTTPGLLIGKTLYAPSAQEMPTVNQLRMMLDDHSAK